MQSLPSADDIEALRASKAKIHPVALSTEERVKPDLGLMRVGPLRELCVTNEIAYSGLNKDQLIERLAKFYDGQIVPKRGSAKDFVRMTRLEDEAPLEQAPLTPARTKAMTSAGSVRSVPAMPKIGSMNAPWSPASAPGLIGPQGRFTEDPSFLEGIPIYHLLCDECRAPMVGRRNRADGGKFFGCSNFSPRGCRFTLTFEEGTSRFRSSLSELHDQVVETRSSGSGHAQ